MFDDFFIRALVAGIGVVLITGPLGCFIVWQRLAYFGDTMAHSALLGIAIALALQIHLFAGVFSICLIAALLLGKVSNRSELPIDSILGILSHSTLAVGLILVSLMYWVRVDILQYLFGSILSVSTADIAEIYLGGALVGGLIIWRWRQLVGTTVSEEIAAAENLRPVQAQYLLMILLAAVVAFAMKIVGIILTASLLIIPAATVRQFSKSPEQMAVFSALAGVVAVVSGLWFSLFADTPSGPSIVFAALILFIITTLLFKLVHYLRNRNTHHVRLGP